VVSFFVRLVQPLTCLVRTKVSPFTCFQTFGYTPPKTENCATRVGKRLLSSILTFDAKKNYKINRVFTKLLLANFFKDIIGCNVPLVKTASMFVRNLIQLLHIFHRICASCSLKMQVLFALKSERFLFQMKNLKILIWCFICVPRFIPLTQIDINYWLI